MDFTKRHGEFEPISTARYHSFDDVGAKPLVVKFLCQVGHFDVFLTEPYPVTDIVLWCLASVRIVELGHVISFLD